MARELVSITDSPAATLEQGYAIGQTLPQGAVVAFYGDLGAGKTTLIKGIVAAVTGLSPDAVNSPTFTYLNIYEGKRNVFHLDLYRLSGLQAFFAAGFDEYLEGEGVCCIEWAERLEGTICHSHTLQLTHLPGGKREIRYEY